MTAKKIFLASDHAGYDLKVRLLESFPDLNWVDLGPENDDRVDYPDFSSKVAEKVSAGEGIGVLVCGSGQGMAIRANRFPGVRAALCWSEEIAELSRGHNDANILCMGARILDHELCERILKTFLEKEFEGGRHAGRVEKIDNPTN